MIEFAQHIKSVFGLAKKEDVDLIVSMFEPATLKKGDFFLKTAKRCDKLSFLQSGLLRVYVETENAEVTQWISQAGEFVTDVSSLIFENPARFNIQALNDCTLLTINRENYTKLGELIPFWYKFEKHFIALYFVMLEDRIFSHLSMSSEERYKRFFELNSDMFNQVPLQYIASMLGMTPETFSRIRNKLRN